MQESMHEYIKKISASLCLLESHIKDNVFKKVIVALSVSLINNNDEDKYADLRKDLIKVVDVLDILKIAGKISLMNAEIILNAVVKIIEELDKEIFHKQSFLLPKFSLSEMSQNILRERARESSQNNFLKNEDENLKDVFEFTKVSEVKGLGLVDSEKSNISPNPSSKRGESAQVQENRESEKNDKKKTEVEKELEVKSGVKFDWGNGDEKKQVSSEPLVYTVFGEEEKMIEERRVKIMTILKIGGGASIGELVKSVPGFNAKTLQRDLLDLMRERKVIMLGKKRWTKYYLK